MATLKGRIEALEMRAAVGNRRWHRIIAGVGVTVQDAIANYERGGSPLGVDNFIVRDIVSPIRSPALAIN